MKELRKTLSDFVKNLPSEKLVLIVDELDRCRPDYAMKSLEVIKHFFDIEGLFIIVPSNEISLNNCVEALYGINQNNNIGLARIEETDSNNIEPPGKLELSEEELSGVLRQYFDGHLRNCLNDKIPILNNMTPKECAIKDPKRLKTWLKMMEENIKEQTQGTYDIVWVYEELGLVRK